MTSRWIGLPALEEGHPNAQGQQTKNLHLLILVKILWIIHKLADGEAPVNRLVVLTPIPLRIRHLCTNIPPKRNAFGKSKGGFHSPSLDGSFQG